MEVVSIVGRPFLSASFQAMFNWLKSHDLLQYVREDQVPNQLEKWEDKLRTIHAVLEDAEEKQITSSSVKIWLSKLRHLAYDVEDVLDELNTEAQRRKYLMAQSASSSAKVSKCTPGCFAGLTMRPSRIKFNKEMLSRISAITAGLDEIVDEKNKLHLVAGDSGRCVRASEGQLPGSLVNAGTIYGRREDVDALVNLVKGEGNDGGISVIPIVGMGGVGKTTLAQLVFNDSRLEFEHKVWLSVGEDFNIVRMTKTVLESLGECPNSDDFNLLQVESQGEVVRKEVLDCLG